MQINLDILQNHRRHLQVQVQQENYSFTRYHPAHDSHLQHIILF